jgi:hypothetical protein
VWELVSRVNLNRKTRICRSGRNVLVAFCLALAANATATSVTVDLPNGAAYAIDIRLLEPSPAAPVQSYLAFSGIEYVLRQFDSGTQKEWDARSGLLWLAVGQQRFSLSTARAEVVVNDKRFQVALPIRYHEGDLWIPLESFRLIGRSLRGVRITESAARVAANAAPTSAPIVQSPGQALTQGILPGAAKTDTSTSATSSPSVAIPPPDATRAWRVVFDPVLIPSADTNEGAGTGLRPSLVRVAERCANLLTEEGSTQASVLTEHDEDTTADLVLEWLSPRSPDLVVFLRFEVSPLRVMPGYSIFYADESVDSPDGDRAAGTTSSLRIVSRDQSYLSFQAGSRQLAETIGAELARLPGFRERLILPAPLYLLKRSPAHAVMIILGFPQRSPELARMTDSGFRETLARALAGALIAFRRENAAPVAEPARSEGSDR